MEQELKTVIRLFDAEAKKLEDRRAGSRITLKLSYQQFAYTRDPPKLEVTAEWWDGSTHQTVKAASLGALMDEVYRRSGFTDRQEAALDHIAQSFVALEAPTSEDELDKSF